MKYDSDMLKLADSLGAITDAKNEPHKSMLDAPAFAREYAESFQWPKSITYCLKGSSEKLYGLSNAGDLDLTHINLHGKIAKVHDDFFADRCIYPIGEVGSSYVLFLDGDDKTPQDPMVHIIDRNLGPDTEINELFRLQEFLSRLEPN